MKKDDIVRAEITQNASVTKSIAYYEGEKILVEGGYAGQLADIRIIKQKRGRTEGVIVRVVNSPDFMCDPPCRDFGACGGCSLMDINYSSQLALKSNYVKSLLTKANIPFETFEDIIPSPDITAYRNKMEYSFGDEVKNGELTLGMHKKNSHYSVIPLKNCSISPDDFNIIRTGVMEYFRNLGALPFDRRTKSGLLRHLVLRRSVSENTVCVNLVTANEYFDKKAFVDFVLSLKVNGKISGIIQTLNDSVADAVVAQKTEVLYGTEFLYEKVCDLTFEISPFSFFQTNTRACELLYNKALEYAGDLKNKTVFDLYCGTGTITQIAAAKAKLVYGIEIVAEAVDSAVKNAEINNLSNCVFIAGDVLEKLDELKGTADVIILDPPRAGINPKALNKIIAYEAETIVYISCKAQSLVAELPVFVAAGYEVKKVCTVDMFPFTSHVETIALMSRSKQL